MAAIISECGKYRYRLDREVQPEGKVFAYFGINPSTADAIRDDQTVKKWIGFTLRNGGRKFIAGNVFSYRATKVTELASAPFPHGPQHLAHLLGIVQEADVLVPCWGSRDKVPKNLHAQIDLLLTWLIATGKPVMCFGVTASGDPKHPQMLSSMAPNWCHGANMFERKNLPIVDLKQRYESGESLETLAVAYGVHRQTVSTRLREAGVKIRSRRNHKAFKYSPEVIERMKELRAQGVKYEAIAMELGCASSTVYVHLAAYRNEHRPVLVEMRDDLKQQMLIYEFASHLTCEQNDHRKKLEARIAALESVI